MCVVSKRITAPRLIHQVEAGYTDAARQAAVQGVVKLQIQIGPDGLVYRPQVLEGLGFGLDEQALAAVQQWRFEPATWGDMPTAVTCNVEVGFQLPPPQPAAPSPEPAKPAEQRPSGETPQLAASEMRRGIRYCEQCDRKVKASPLGYCPKCGARLPRKPRR